MAQRDKNSGLFEEVIAIRFHTKVTKGGRNLSVGVLVAVGDGRGKIGIGYGKARGVPAAIEKAAKEGRAAMVPISLIGDTVGHEAWGSHGSVRVLIKPASPGTGVKAGKTVRAMMQVLGVHNVLTKVYGPTNPLNVAKATLDALRQMHTVAELEALRGVQIQISHPQARLKAQEEAAAAAAETAEAATAVAVAEQEPAPAEAPEAETEPEAETGPQQNAATEETVAEAEPKPEGAVEPKAEAEPQQDVGAEEAEPEADPGGQDE